MTVLHTYFAPGYTFAPHFDPVRNQKNYIRALAVIKLLATNAKKAAQHASPFTQEAKDLIQTAERIERRLVQLHNRPHIPQEETPLDKIIIQHGLSLKVSTTMLTLCREHLVQSALQQEKQWDGTIKPRTNYALCKDHLSKHIETEDLKKILRRAQTGTPIPT